MHESTITTPPVAPVRPSYPDTPREDIEETLHGQVVQDPYRWLENPADERVQAWMRAQDELTQGHLAGLPVRERLHERLRELSYHDSISVPDRRKGRYFYTRRRAAQDKAVLTWKRGDDGAETVLLDPGAMSDDGSVSLGGFWPSPDGTKIAYKLTKNNADAATMYVMDVDSGETSVIDVIDGAKYAYAAWTADSKGFYYTRLPTDPSIPLPDLPGHAHIRHHVLGQSPDKDALVFPATGDPRMFVSPSVSHDGRFLFVTMYHGRNDTDVFLKDLRRKPARARKLPKSAPSWQQHGFSALATGIPAYFHAEAWNGSLYVLTNHEAPQYRMFKVAPERLDRAAWREIVPEDKAVLESFDIIGNHLVLTYLRDATNHIDVRTLDGAPVRSVTLPGPGSVLDIGGNEGEDDMFYQYSSYTEPPQIYRSSVSSGKSSLWARVEVPVDMSRFVVEQVWYPSRDGTRISMFIIRRKDARPDGQNPTLLHGYGGFNISKTPEFSTLATVWLEQGGIYAVANLRGGGEYGETWHQAGMLLDKQNVFDDFIHAARHLIDSGWTRPERLAIWGRSNGGLLVGAAMTQEPSLFKAVVCVVPLLDMVRYHLFGSGKTWIPEYGSADDATQFAALYAYSPYHRVRKGTRYPALFMLSADSDDRVDPMHARKLVAAVQWAQAADAPVLLRIEPNAGHAGADIIRQRVRMESEQLAFLMHQLGM